MAAASNPFSPDFTSNDSAAGGNGFSAASGDTLDTFDLLASPTTAAATTGAPNTGYSQPFPSSLQKQEETKKDLSGAFVFPDYSNTTSSTAASTASAMNNTGMAPQQSTVAVSSYPATLSQQPLSAFDMSMSSPAASALNTGNDDDGFGGPMGGTSGGLGIGSHGTMNSSSASMQSPPPLVSNDHHNSHDPTAVIGGNGTSNLGTNQTNAGLNGPKAPPPLQNHTQSPLATADTASVASSSALTTNNNNQGDDSKEEGEDTEEDKMFKQAEQAALEAEKMIKMQAEETKKKQEEGGLLGLGIKAPQMPHLFGNNNDTNADGTTTTPTKKAPWFQTATTTRDASTPPWHGTPQNATAHAATSDFGIPPPATHDLTTTPSGGQNGNGTPGKGAAVMGATVVGGVAGLMMMGPLVGIAAAGGACYAAGTKEGPVGSLLRGTGSLAATAGGAAKRFDDKHHVVGKTVSGLATGVGWIVKTVNGATPD